MANIRKSFNFRSGLQVDNDNFVINSNGLVGIGTSVPSDYLLNVYGDSRVTGLVTASNAYLTQNLEVIGDTTLDCVSANNAQIGAALTVAQLQVGSSELVDNIIGYARTTFITDNGGVGFHTTSKLGINTTISPGASDPEFNVYGDVNVTGLVTATTFNGSLDAVNLTGTIDNARLPEIISVTDITATTFNGDLNGDATGLTGNPIIVVDDVTSSNINNSGNITSTNINISGIATISTLKTTNIDNSSTISSPSITASDSIGIGTDDTTYEQHIRRSDKSILKITSDQNESIIAIGRSTSYTDTNNNNALIKFGNFNSYIDNNGVNNYFMWLRGSNNPLMTLTRNGNLGIGITNPSHKLSVQGISTFSGNAYFNSNITLDGNLILTSGSFTGNVTGDVTGNVTALTGTSSFNDVTGAAATFTSLNVDTDDAIFGANIGVGTTAPNSAVDFENAGVVQKRFIIPPKVSTTERDDFSITLTEGALIYNVTNQRLELYNGTSWVGIATVA